MKLGLSLTRNSKVGAAFSISRTKTCVNKTTVCSNACYGNSIRYRSSAQKEKRERNYETAELLLKKGGAFLLAENLMMLIDQARPLDWLAAKIIGVQPEAPWTVRIHDIGDFYSVEYCQAWTIAARARPDCSFWFYTRTFEPSISAALVELAKLPNCQGWISLDRENFRQGLRLFGKHPGVFKLALLQEEEYLMPRELMRKLSATVKTQELVSFPRHRGGRHVKEMRIKNATVCPQVLGAFELVTSFNLPKPCQSCAFCLPTN